MMEIMAAPSLNLGDRGERVALDLLIRHGLRGERFSKDEMKKSKTPDFRVFKDDQFIFFNGGASPYCFSHQTTTRTRFAPHKKIKMVSLKPPQPGAFPSCL